MGAHRLERLIQVVPRLGPFDGVGDYALRLAQQLRECYALPSSFIETGLRQRDGDCEAGFEVLRCEAGSAAALSSALRQSGVGPERGVLLHYVGYGYAKRGVPLWLARAVASTRQSLGYRLGVVFHELYANGRPWESSFWLSGLQQSVAARIGRECDCALLTRESSRHWLDRAGVLGGKAVEVLPVPSTVGEPAEVAPVSARDPTLVVWGSSELKSAVYRRHWPRLLKACRAFGVVRISDVGGRLETYPSGNEIEIQSHGLLPAPAVSRILAGARLGLIVYPVSFLGKSSLFAAYAAHGVAPLVLDDSAVPATDGLVSGRHFLPLGGSAGGEQAAALDDIAVNARAWYSGHTTGRHAAAVSAMFQGSSR
jgi:hypothetical protein